MGDKSLAHPPIQNHPNARMWISRCPLVSPSTGEAAGAKVSQRLEQGSNCPNMAMSLKIAFVLHLAAFSCCDRPRSTPASYSHPKNQESLPRRRGSCDPRSRPICRSHKHRPGSSIGTSESVLSTSYFDTNAALPSVDDGSCRTLPCEHHICPS